MLAAGDPCPICGEPLVLGEFYVLRCRTNGCGNRERLEYHAEKRLPGGRIAHVTPIGAAQGRLTSGLESAFRIGTWEDCWDYPTIDRAVAALERWDGDGDPEDGWTRQIPSNRRRPNGDPAQEFIRP